MGKPDILTITTEKELRRWYWKKSELMELAKHRHISAYGSKFDILDRICDNLEGRQTKVYRKKPSSTFDWAKEEITIHTTITDSYKSSEKVRRFMKSQIPDFKFNIAFMEWVKSNVGKKMGDAIAFYLEHQGNSAKTTIKPHNQWNQYMRDFFEANPDKTIEDARKCWAYKTKLPSDTGRHVYDNSDLQAL